ncbi:putative cation efflux system protein [Glaciecola nitratireducens FR1064]|uniref:Putative cation efflux system protein n=2 Tax=Brumicola TaxID=3160924 RepID=G4QNM3_GLANF|nr:efflux RND transporter periplasmic adaptor subunit [Glaciecola nitratireducens]AEP31581.1 putative cation efflux system protein [Glaciecola nitratireducens FR1064]
MNSTQETTSGKKSSSASKIVLLGIGLVIGVIVTLISYKFMLGETASSSASMQATESEPLYWVAPMDPNFKRDKPGLSPMGMDLVPVYADDENGGGKDSPGTIRIDPNVVNNLGVKTAKVQRRALDVTIKTVGYVQYNEDTLVHVHPRVEGWIEVLNVKAAGEYVKKGEPLFALYSPELVNAQEEFLLAVKRANRNLMAAAKSRLQALQMPKIAIDKLVESEKVQQTVVFTASQTGFVDNLNIREGFYVKPGMTLMSIAALDEVWVDAEIFERQSNLVKLGLPVVMTMEYLPGKTWEGQVDYIYPTMDASTRTLRARLRFSNEDYFLKPNMFAQVSIFTGKSAMHKSSDENMHELMQESQVDELNIVVPSEAVIRTGTQNRVVLALGDGKFKSVEVNIGNVVEIVTDPNAPHSGHTTMKAALKSGNYTEVLSGLMDGDTVVTSAQFLLDSESSISSDFIRIGGELDRSKTALAEGEDEKMNDMSNMSNMSDMGGMSGMGGMNEPVWVEATVDDAMPEERMVRLTHGDIDDWGMPGMTMNFVVAEDVDFTQLAEGQTLQVLLQKPESGMFEVVGVKP